jgi:tRNA(Ile)-lysidine synthetase-like protein
VPEIGRSFVFELIPLSPAGARYNKKEGLLDCRVAEACLTLRNWRPGDLYRPTGHGRRKKLKELFQRNRIPLRERAAWPVLVAGDRILWAGRLGAAEGFTPPEGSRQAILIRECTL